MLTAVLPLWHMGVHRCVQMSACPWAPMSIYFLNVRRSIALLSCTLWECNLPEEEQNAEGFIHPYKLMSYGKNSFTLMKSCSWQITWPGFQGCCSAHLQCSLWIPKLSALMKGMWTCFWPYTAQANVSILWPEEIECSLWGFPGDSAVKNLPSNAGDTGSIPGSGWSPGGGNGNPLQYSYQEKISWIEEPESENVVTQSCLTPWNPMDCSPPGSFVHGIL